MEKFNIDIMELILKKLSYHDANNFKSVFTEAERAFQISPNIKDIISDNTLLNIENGWEEILFSILNKCNISKIVIDKYIIRIFYKEGITIILDYTQHSGLKNEFKLNVYYKSSINFKTSNILSFHIYQIKYSALENIFISSSIGDNKLLSYTTIYPLYLNKDLLLKSKHFFTETVNKNIKSNYLNFTRKLIKKINNIWYYELLDAYYSCLRMLYDILTPLSIDGENIEFDINDDDTVNDLEYEKQIYTRIHEHVSLLHIDINLHVLMSVFNEDVSISSSIINKDIELQINY